MIQRDREPCRERERERERERDPSSTSHLSTPNYILFQWLVLMVSKHIARNIILSRKMRTDQCELSTSSWVYLFFKWKLLVSKTDISDTLRFYGLTFETLLVSSVRSFWTRETTDLAGWFITMRQHKNMSGCNRVNIKGRYRMPKLNRLTF